MTAKRPLSQMPRAFPSRLSRRSALQAAGAALAGVAMRPVVAADAGAPTTDCDVIVVGGGFAGVTAARECSKLGLRTVLLEARERLGGRTFTGEFHGHLVELGGTWVHWSQPFVWSEVQRYGLEVEETPGATPDQVIVLSEGQAARRDAASGIGAIAGAMDRYFEEARLVWERPYDAAFRWQEILRRDALSAAARMQAIGLPPFERAALTGLIETMSNCPLEQTSYVEMMRWYALPGWSITGAFDSLSRYKLKKGTAALIECMVKDGHAQIRLNSPVRQIEQDASGVSAITAAGERLRGRALVLALPMNLLQTVEFSPALSAAKIQASREGHTGVGQKLFVALRGKLGNLLLVAPHGAGIGTFWTYAAGENETLLVGFSADDSLDAMDEESVQAGIRRFLPDVSVIASGGHAWQRDPYARGTYASFRPGAFGKYYEATLRDEGRVVMGLGDWGEGWRGFIDGAIGSGIRAGQRVARLLLE